MTAAGKAMARSSRADASSRLPGKAPAGGAPRGGVNQRLQALLPKLVLSPSVFLVLVFVYGFIAFTGYLSFTGSRILPSFELVASTTTCDSSRSGTGASRSGTSRSSACSTSPCAP